jgi:hypothetical protein
MSSNSINQIIDYNNKTISGGLDLRGLIQSASLNPISGSATTTIIHTETIEPNVMQENVMQESENDRIPIITQTITQTPSQLINKLHK